MAKVKARASKMDLRVSWTKGQYEREKGHY